MAVQFVFAIVALVVVIVVHARSQERSIAAMTAARTETELTCDSSSALPASAAVPSSDGCSTSAAPRSSADLT